MNRRTFLAYVRNKVAVGVLCSGMLAESLKQSLPKIAEVPTATVVRSHFAQYSLGFKQDLKRIFHDAYRDLPEEYPALFNKVIKDGLQSEQTRGNKE